MTVSSTTDKITYDGDGSTATFSFPFKILAESNLLVQIKDSNGNITTKTLTSDYTVSGTGNRIGKTDYTSGNITFTSGNIPASTDEVILSRSLALTQETDYTENGKFPAESNESALDKLTLISQSLNEVLGRSLKFDSGVTSFAQTLPSPKADKFLKINSAGDAFNLSDDTSIIGDLSKADGTFYVGDGTTVVAETGSTARDSIGLGTGDTVEFGLIQDSNVTNTTGTAYTVTTSGAAGDITLQTDNTSINLDQGADTASVATSTVTFTVDTSTALSGATNVDLNSATLDLGNLNFDTNTISSTNTDGDVDTNPNGAGNINLRSTTVGIEQDLVHLGDSDNKFVFGTDTQDFQTGGSSRLDISNSGVRLGGANSRVTTILDEDDLISDSATSLATQQSIKSYVDTQVGGGASANFSVISSDPSPAADGGQYACDTSSSGFTVTLPSSPSDGTSLVSIMDYTGSFATNSLTIGRNGNNIMGLSEDMTISTDNAVMTLVYIDATEGWRIF